MTGQTTRQITTTLHDRNRVVVGTRTYPAGTTVHITGPRWDGTYKARVAGTRYEQRVTLDTVKPF